MSAAERAAPSVSVVVAGAAGRMGSRIVACLRDTPDLRLVAALEAPGHPAAGRDAAAAIARDRMLVEFSAPEPTLEHLRRAAEVGARAVIGTTGFTSLQRG